METINSLLSYVIDNLSNPRLGIIIGFVIWLVYIGVSYAKKNQTNPKLNESVLIFLSTTGIVAGINLLKLASTAHVEECNELNSISVYIAIGGVAVIWSSIETMSPCFKPIKPKKP